MNPTIMESLPVLSLVVVGFVLKKIGVLKTEDGSFFSRIILFITLPCLIFLSISQAQIESGQLAILALGGLTIPLILRILSGGVTRYLKLEDSIAGVVILCSMVMNIGAMMMPIVQTVYGADGVSRTAAFDIGNSFMASGYGYYIASRYGTKNSDGILKSIKRVFTVPVVWAVIIGVVFNLANIVTPAFFTKILSPLSAANAPLAMLSLGVFVNFKFPRWKLVGMTVFLRMGIGFLLGILFVFLLDLQGMDRTIVIMAAAMPIGMVPLVYAANEGLDTEFAAACISLSIIIGIIITPFLLTI